MKYESVRQSKGLKSQLLCKFFYTVIGISFLSISTWILLYRLEHEFLHIHTKIDVCTVHYPSKYG